MIFFLVTLGLLVQAVDDAVKVVEGSESVIEHFCGLLLLKDYKTVLSLVQCAFNDFIKNHLAQFLQNSVHWEANALGDIIDLYLRVWLYYFLKVVFQ